MAGAETIIEGEWITVAEIQEISAAMVMSVHIAAIFTINIEVPCRVEYKREYAHAATHSL